MVPAIPAAAQAASLQAIASLIWNAESLSGLPNLTPLACASLAAFICPSLNQVPLK